MMKSLLMTIVLMVISASVYAHDPTEITYEFAGDSLTIHLTPKGALDLITFIHPDLADQESIHLSHYTLDYGNYFNNRIEIRRLDKSIRLEYLASDLTKHDSFIRFRLSDFDGDYRETSIKIAAFEEIYARVQNTIIGPDGLAKGNTVFQVIKEPFVKVGIPYYWYILFLGLVGLVILYLYQRS